uniref:Uncharacterized protein n=1 Tax=Onchocerca volvulus TaxID=6282 RepID=A0A8R1XW37_ONCVO
MPCIIALIDRLFLQTTSDGHCRNKPINTACVVLECIILSYANSSSATWTANCIQTFRRNY